MALFAIGRDPGRPVGAVLSEPSSFELRRALMSLGINSLSSGGLAVGANGWPLWRFWSESGNSKLYNDVMYSD